jgi:hypothetical protein
MEEVSMSVVWNTISLPLLPLVSGIFGNLLEERGEGRRGFRSKRGGRRREGGEGKEKLGEYKVRWWEKDKMGSEGIRES